MLSAPLCCRLCRAEVIEPKQQHVRKCTALAYMQQTEKCIETSENRCATTSSQPARPLSARKSFTQGANCAMTGPCVSYASLAS